MKNVKSVGFVLVSAVITMACAVEGDDLEERDAVVDEIVENLQLAGYPDGEIEVTEDSEVIVGGDAVVGLQASREMIGLVDEHDEPDGFRQYRTSNLVSGSVSTICIDGSRYSGTMSTALDNAIANYNGLNLSFSMVRTNGGGAGCDATITAYAKGPAGGQAGFPEGGMPYDQFQVGKGTASYGVDVVTHVITHELGHCVGLRHSDYFNRAISCGSGGNEGAAGVGAVHIQGTPTGASFDGSVMNSCFHSGSTGDWTNSDQSALNALY